jgi:hypothetical protein
MKNMRVVTWNLFAGSPCGRTPNLGGRRLRDQIDALKGENADVMYLQEIYTVDAMEVLVGAFPSYYHLYRRRYAPYTLWLFATWLFLPPPFPLFPLALFFLWVCFRRTAVFAFVFGGVGGTLLLSRAPILRGGVRTFRRQACGIDWLRWREFIWVHLVWEKTPLSVGGVHCSLDTRCTSSQMSDCASCLTSTCILVGDTNAGRDVMEGIERGLGLSWLPTGVTWSASNPLTRDYFNLPDHISDAVFVRGCLGDARSVQLYLSDHYMVSADISFRK